MILLPHLLPIDYWKRRSAASRTRLAPPLLAAQSDAAVSWPRHYYFLWLRPRLLHSTPAHPTSLPRKGFSFFNNPIYTRSLIDWSGQDCRQPVIIYYPTRLGLFSFFVLFLSSQFRGFITSLPPRVASSSWCFACRVEADIGAARLIWFSWSRDFLIRHLKSDSFSSDLS